MLADCERDKPLPPELARKELSAKEMDELAATCGAGAIIEWACSFRPEEQVVDSTSD